MEKAVIKLPSIGQERSRIEEWEGKRDSFKEEMAFELGFGGCLGHGPSEKEEEVIPSRGVSTTTGVKVRNNSQVTG